MCVQSNFKIKFLDIAIAKKGVKAKKGAMAKNGTIDKIICFHSKTVLLVVFILPLYQNL